MVEVEEKKSIVIEAEAALIQGIFGVGGERYGKILALDCTSQSVIDAGFLSKYGKSLNGQILVGGSHFTVDALRFAAECGACAVVTGSVDAETLYSFVGHEIGVAITGDEDVPLTVVVTEGFGMLDISSRVTELAKHFSGMNASVNGATQVRAGATRPEVVVPHASDGSVTDTESAKTLGIGARVRIIRVPYFGAFGEVTELPKEPEVIPSGAKVRVLRARLSNGEEVTVPRANVELV